MKNKLSGFMPVFRYTLKTQLKSKKFIAITLIFAIILLGGAAAAFVLLNQPEEEVDASEFNIEKAYVIDDTGLGIADFSAYAKQLEDEYLTGVDFEECTDEDKLIEEEGEDNDFVLVKQTETEDGYLLRIITSDDSDIDGELLDVFGEGLVACFQLHVYKASGLSEAALANALIQTDYTTLSFDSDEDEMKDIIEVIVFMLLLFVIYMIVLLYGQKICSEVSMEKSSKLVEQLLTSVTPYGLVAGKVFAVILTSLIQFIIWIVAAIWGIFGGDAMAKMLYPNYESKVDYALNMIRELFGMMAFDKAAVVMAIVLMLVGIIFYLVLAGFAGSFVTKPENAASVQMLFVMPIVISFMIDLIQLVNGEGSVSNVLHFIPFTAAMITPGAMLLGAIPLWMGIVSAVISIIGAMLLMYVAAKIYKALLFFNGAKLTPKLVLGMFKAKK